MLVLQLSKTLRLVTCTPRILLFRVYSVAALTPHSVAAATFPRHSYPWILLRSRNYDKLQVHSKSEAVARPLRDGLTR